MSSAMASASPKAAAAFLAMLMTAALAIPNEQGLVVGEESGKHLSFVIGSAVQELDATNFDETVKKYSFVLVNFYAPWCPNCQALADDYEAAALVLKYDKPPIILAAVDCTVEKNRKLCSIHGVDQFPTLKIFKTSPGLGQSEYPYYLGNGRDQRTAVAIIKGLRLEAALK